MNVPQYIAWLSVNHFKPITEYVDPYTYERPAAALRVVFPEHYELEGPDYSYSTTLDMRPIMGNYDPAGAYGANASDGAADGAYGELLPKEEVTPHFFDGHWTYARMLQLMVPAWEQSRFYHGLWLAAFEARKIEDTWITEAQYWTELQYTNDQALGIYSEDVYIRDAGTRVAQLESGFFTNQLVLQQSITPCKTEAKVRYRAAVYTLRRYIDSVIAFADSDPPIVEQVTAQACAPMVVPTIYYAIDLPEAQRQLIPVAAGTGIYVHSAQPLRWTTPIDLAAAEAEAIAYVMDGAAPGASWAYQLPDPQLIDYIPDRFDERITSGYSDANYATQSEDMQLMRMSYTSRGVERGTTTAGWSWIVERPTPWKFDDPEFVDCIPLCTELLAQPGLLRSYIHNPSNIFDGLYFWRKIRLSSLTRSWFAAVMHHTDGVEPDWFGSPLHSAFVRIWGFRDSDTGELVHTGGTEGDYCPGLVALETTSLSPDVIYPVEIEDGFWGDYEWPNLSITIPGGSFLLTDGSDAPIYPDFHGAYVYDLHLKKWGKFQGEYKRLIDYAAINTFLPGEQSYSRFGIFGGVLQEDGTIRLFNARPSDSKIVYGKIGYYRQGMTSPEEVRVHMRTASTGTLELESSVEGKLITAGFGQSWDFINEVSWIGYGGYSAKWHNIVVKGQFDISYLEFRGITSGRR